MSLVRVLTRALAAGCLVGATVVPVVAAEAVKPEKIDYTVTFSGVDPEFCGVEGFEVAFHVVVEGVLKIRDQRGQEYWSDRSVINGSFTANGVTVTEVVKPFWKDLKVEAVGDTLVITYFGTGPATVYGPDGKAIARNPGQVRFRAVIDAATGDELELEVLKGSTGRNDDFCEAVVPALTG